ncbi:MAG: hypothetical protein WAU75_11430 [Solirubrobacteraceae bacterium]
MEDDSHIDAGARRAVDAMWRREYALGVEGRFAEQIACVDEAQRRYADSADAEVRAVAVRMFSGHVRAALATGDQRGAVAASRRLVLALAGETDPVVRLALAETVLALAGGIALAAPGATGPIASVAFAPLHRFAALRGRVRIKSALRRRARMLEGLELAQRLIDEFEESPDASLRSVAVQAILLAGAISVLLGRWKRAGKLFELVFDHGGARVATVIDLARPRIDGRYTGVERAAAIVAREHPATRSRATPILQGWSPGRAVLSALSRRLR